jgi:hypothetical protein
MKGRQKYPITPEAVAIPELPSDQQSICLFTRLQPAARRPQTALRRNAPPTGNLSYSMMLTE